MVLEEKYSQEYHANAEFLQGSILAPKLFLLYTNDLPDDAICNVAVYADDSTLYSKCELESDIRDTVDWGKK